VPLELRLLRLEKRLRMLGVRPHEDKKLDDGEGDPASRIPKHAFFPPIDKPDPEYPSPRGLRKMKRRKS
jgi:hypothetical protein